MATSTLLRLGRRYSFDAVTTLAPIRPRRRYDLDADTTSTLIRLRRRYDCHGFGADTVSALTRLRRLHDFGAITTNRMALKGAAKIPEDLNDIDETDESDGIPYEAPDLHFPPGSGDAATRETRATRGKEGKSLPKFPCGNCRKGCTKGTSLMCGFCEFWYHSNCVDGMTPEFIESCDKMSRMTGNSAFLCLICRKLVGRINISLRDLQAQIKQLHTELKTAKLERDFMAAKIEKMANETAQVTEKVIVVEKGIESEMEKAKEEVKEEMTTELKEREERSVNLVVYGVAESQRPTGAEKQAEDVETVTKMAEAIGVELKGAVEVRYRAGKKVPEATRPRPMVVRIEDEETRERMLANARKLARKEEWKEVFVSRDLTYKQQMEANKLEDKLRKDAKRMNDQAKNEGRGGGSYRVVGVRAKNRRVEWREERGARGGE